MSSKIPEFRTDEELEAFLKQDLSDYITPENFKPARFEFLPKTRPGSGRGKKDTPTRATSANRSSARSTTAAETGNATTSSSERSSKLRSVRKRLTSCDGVNMNRERRTRGGQCNGLLRIKRIPSVCVARR